MFVISLSVLMNTLALALSPLLEEAFILELEPGFENESILHWINPCRHCYDARLQKSELTQKVEKLVTFFQQARKN